MLSFLSTVSTYTEKTFGLAPYVIALCQHTLDLVKLALCRECIECFDCFWIENWLHIKKVMDRNVWMCFVLTALIYSIECIACFDLCINNVDKQHSIHYSMHCVL